MLVRELRRRTWTPMISKQCSELHVRHHFWSVWTADAAFLRGFGPTISSGLYPIRKCPQSGPRTWGLGGDLDRLNHRPLATSAADRSAIRNTVFNTPRQPKIISTNAPEKDGFAERMLLAHGHQA